MAITSKLSQSRRFGVVAIADWQASGLPKKSVIKPVVFTLDKRLILKKYGSLDAQTLTDLRSTIADIFA